MSLDSNELEALMQSIAQEMGDGCERSRLTGQKRDFLGLFARPQRVFWKGFTVSITALMTVAAVLILMWIFVPSEGLFSFEVGVDKVAGKEGQWLEATQEQSLPIVFADHSELRLQGPTRARVVASTKQKVQILLDEGNLTANVLSKGKRQWTFLAGPFEIRDLGTRFSIQWERAAAELEVEVWEGQVQVTGPSLDVSGVVVSAHEKVRINTDGKKLDSSPEVDKPDLSEVESAADPGKQDLLEETAPASEDRHRSAVSKKHRIHRKTRFQSDTVDAANGSTPGSSVYRTSSLESAKNRLPEEWQTLFEKGRYAELMALAKKSGLEQWLSSLDLPELWRVAEAARYAKQVKEANQVLLTVRHRFPSSWHARVAAYLLGRLAMQQDHEPALAVKWLTIYLQEDPDGSLAEEALGRLISAYQYLGQKKQAQSTAQTYLQRYPDGMFTSLAQSVIR